MNFHFYTNCFLYKNQIYYTGYDNGERIKRKVNYEPYLFLSSKTETGWKTLEGQHVQKKTFSNISEAQKFIREHKGIENFQYYGNTNFLYAWINDTFPDKMKYDSSLINIIHLDIEVASDKGLPDYRNADKEVTLITIGKHGKKITFGSKEYTPKGPDSVFVPCKDEAALLKKFLVVWNNPQYNPDVLTGWNVEGFDIPYLYNRIRNLLGQEMANKLSPWGIVEEKEVRFKFKETTEFVYDLKGISTLDYYLLYKKFSYKNQESFSLNFIASAELGEKKTDYSKYESLLQLYNEDYELYVDYNINDVVLVEKLDDKLKLIEQVFALAYDAKVTYNDTLTTIRTWDTMIHNYLLDQFIVVPQMKKQHDEELIGAFVKEPQLGMHKWVVSFDLTSLYPHLIMQYNISPDTFVSRGNIPEDPNKPKDHWDGKSVHIKDIHWDIEKVIEEVIKGKLDQLINKQDYACTANLCLYRRDKQGFLPALMEKIYKDRDRYKKQMITAQKKYEETKDPSLLKKIAQFNYLQMAKKIQLNSGYGAVANPYFRFYSHNNAEAITSSGQLAIRWAERALNKYLQKLLKTEKDYIIAVDTDSLYVDMEDFVKKCKLEDATPQKIVDFLCKSSDQLLKVIEEGYEELATYTNARNNMMIMKREAIAEKGIWTAKKKYVLNVWDSEGVRYSEPQLKITGIESVRSSTPSSCRGNIKKTLGIIMNEDQAALLRFIEKFHKEFETLPVDEIAFPRSISGLTRYRNAATIYSKATPIQVKGALIYNHLIAKNNLDNMYPIIYNGDKIKFVYLKEPNPLHEHVISFVNAVPKQFGLENFIDYERQFQKGFLDPVRLIVEVIGWKLEDTATLEGFM